MQKYSADADADADDALSSCTASLEHDDNRDGKGEVCQQEIMATFRP